MPLRILKFWFEEIDKKCWFTKSSDFDAEITQRFGELHRAAKHCELYGWRKSAAGRLAEIIILDQFSRNMYRDSREAFACDSLALALAQEAVACGDDQKVAPEQRHFLYMPYMHSESRLIHQQAQVLFETLGSEDSLQYELKHKRIIDEFGRYPHRNEILGRKSSEEEKQFLAKPGSSF